MNHPPAAARRLTHAAEVLADLAGATPESLTGLEEELPVEATVACGNCRLYGGVEPPQAFPSWIAPVAADRLVHLLEKAARDADRLPEILNGCSPEEAEDTLAGLLHARMDSWAAMLQLNAVADSEKDPASKAALEAAIDRFDAALDRFDRSLFARQRQLCTLTGTHLLSNLRDLLAPVHGDPLPWWLDGRLEADAIDQLADETLFAPRGPAPVPSLPTVGALRQTLPKIYAAAAAVAGTALQPLPRFRWQSPDGALVGRIVPPVVRQPAPDRVAIDFADHAGRPALTLVGEPCSLAGVSTMIEKLSIVGEDRAAAIFPGTAFFGTDSVLLDESPLLLLVGRSPTPWAAD